LYGAKGLAGSISCCFGRKLCGNCFECTAEERIQKLKVFGLNFDLQVALHDSDEVQREFN
jgi:hypothetical protein